jgi:ethanolaminephosphotransferase
MVIDALKADFITGPNGVKHMPYLASLVSKGEACIFTAKANPPTVTMPRIKVIQLLQ